jgi:hypothetical protein
MLLGAGLGLAYKNFRFLRAPQVRGRRQILSEVRRPVRCAQRRATSQVIRSAVVAPQSEVSCGAQADRVVNPQPAPDDCADVTCAACEGRRMVELLDALTHRESLRLFVAALLARSPIRCAR